MIKKIVIVAGIVGVLVASVLVLCWRFDPYAFFSTRYLAGFSPEEENHHLPVTAEWELQSEGMPPLAFETKPKDLVRILGTPKSVTAFKPRERDLAFYLYIGSSNFAFNKDGLCYAYLQLKDFPNVEIDGHRVQDQDRTSIKALGYKLLAEGRQDLKFQLAEGRFFKVGFVSDGVNPSGRPFYLSFGKE